MEEAGSDAQREEKKNREEGWRELDDMTGKGRSKGPGKGREMAIRRTTVRSDDQSLSRVSFPLSEGDHKRSRRVNSEPFDYLLVLSQLTVP
jgi:hypothetical protein